MRRRAQILVAAYQSSKFSADLGKAVRGGKLIHAKAGYWVHGLPPLGTFRAVAGSIRRLTSDEEPALHESLVISSHLALEDEAREAAVVFRKGEKAGPNQDMVLVGNPKVLPHWKRVAEQYLDGWSLRKNGIYLHERGINGKRGGNMGHSAVGNFLSNRALIGEVEYTHTVGPDEKETHFIDANWGPLVDPNLWEAVQERMNKRAGGPNAKRKAREKYPLAPKCVHCGSP